MARATESEVKAIISTTLTAEEVAPFLASANTLVTEHLSGEGYSADLLKNIELWLAAHLVAIRDPQVSKERYGDGEQTFHGKTGTGLSATLYGQQVLLFDTNGVLANMEKGIKEAVIEVIRYE